MRGVQATGDTSQAGQGVNIFGYFKGEFGLAEAARAYAGALLGAGYPVSLLDVPIELPHSMDHRSMEGLVSAESPHGINLIFVNPDYLPQALEVIGRDRLDGKYTIACWFWELEVIPDEWHAAIASVDEIMVASEFVAGAFHRATSKPILTVPLPLAPIADSNLQRVDFGLPEEDFVFLSSFDFNSWPARKNPLGAISAFRLAFPSGHEDVRLLVKSSNGHRYPDKLLALLEAASSDARIVVRDEVIAREHVHALQRCADAYVSLHRAEGFGLGLAECMASGKPVVGTGWSGNMEFMDAGNSCLVEYALVPVGDGEYPHPEGALWAEPSVEAAAAAMRRLVDEPGFAARIGATGRADVERLLAHGRSAATMIERFERIHSERADRGELRHD